MVLAMHRRKLISIYQNAEIPDLKITARIIKV